jgi:RNA-directed DNA polymerase
VCKHETLYEAYRLAKENNGAPGVDGVSFKDIEVDGVERFIDQLRQELVERTYRPQRLRKVAIPKGGGGSRGLSIPTIRDRVAQGALKLILESVFEADFQPGSFGYRPKRSAHDAIERVSNAIVQGKTYVIDLDLRAYFDTVSHSLVLDKVAQRVGDDAILRLLKLMLKASGKCGVAQGGVISPLLSNLYLTEVDKMLERMKRITAHGSWAVLIDGHPRQRGLGSVVEQRLRRELAKLRLEVNEDKTRRVDLTQGQCFAFLGFLFRRIRSRQGRWMPLRLPQIKKRTALLRKLKAIFRRFVSQPVEWVIAQINPILRGWVTYFAFGNSSRCFAYVRQWVDKKIRRHLARSSKRQGVGSGNGGVGDGCTIRWGSLMPIACPIDQRRRKRAQLMRSHKL